MNRYIINSTRYFLITILFLSCIKEVDLSKRDEEKKQEEQEETVYIYPFKKESHDITAELTISTDGKIDLNEIEVEIPPLKYNKSWLFLLTQDDCSQTAYCNTWAAIHGKTVILEILLRCGPFKSRRLTPGQLQSR